MRLRPFTCVVQFYANGDSRISPFSILLIFFWPVADTGLAIAALENGEPSVPDAFIFSNFAFAPNSFLAEIGTHREPLSTVLLTPFITAPQVLGVMYWDNFAATVWCTSGMALLLLLLI